MESQTSGAVKLLEMHHAIPFPNAQKAYSSVGATAVGRSRSNQRTCTHTYMQASDCSLDARPGEREMITIRAQK